MPEGESKPSKGEKGEIRVTKGTFKWDLQSEDPILSDINFHVKSGELVAIVGHIGSGKFRVRKYYLNIRSEIPFFKELEAFSNSTYSRLYWPLV